MADPSKGAPPPAYSDVPGSIPNPNPGQGYAYPPGAQPMHPQYPQPQTQGVLFTPAVAVVNTNVIRVGPHPARVQCPNCRQQILTSTQSSPGLMSWVVGGILCALGFWCCAFIPCCCCESWNSVTHTCPNCHAFVGRFQGGM